CALAAPAGSTASVTWRNSASARMKRPAGSGNEDDLAVGAGLHDLFLSANDFAERNLLAHHGAKRAVLQAGENRGVDFLRFGFADAPEREAVYGGPARHQISRRDRNIAPAPNDNHPPVGGEQLQVVSQVYIGEHLEDEVHPPPSGRFQNLLPIAGRGVIENVVRAFALCQFETFFRAGRAQDGQAAGASELNGGDTDAAAGAVNQHDLPGAGFGGLMQR